VVESQLAGQGITNCDPSIFPFAYSLKPCPASESWPPEARFGRLRIQGQIAPQEATNSGRSKPQAVGAGQTFGGYPTGRLGACIRDLVIRTRMRN
jgi:hypothetical protein